MKKKTLFVLSVCLTLEALLSTRASLAAPYYEGKRITMIIGSEPGGGNDRMGRLLAKHLSKHIPGKPVIIVENMAGASGIVAANRLYNLTRPDGLTFGTFDRGITFAQLLKAEGVKVDLPKFSWIGSSAIEATVLAIRADLPYKTIEDLRKTKEPLHLASSGVGTQDYTFPILLKEFVGVNLGLVIYPSSSASMLAIERKEADGRGSSYSSMKPYIARGMVRAVIRGRLSEADIDNLPVDEDFTTDKMGKTFMSMQSNVGKLGRPYVAPPGTPSEVMNILRDAFSKVTKDPELIADAKRLQTEVDYVPADECLKVLNFVFSQPPEVVKEFSKYIKF